MISYFSFNFDRKSTFTFERSLNSELTSHNQRLGNTKSLVSSWIPDISGFICTKLSGMISGFRNTKFYKNLLRIIGEDRKKNDEAFKPYMQLYIFIQTCELQFGLSLYYESPDWGLYVCTFFLGLNSIRLAYF